MAQGAAKLQKIIGQLRAIQLPHELHVEQQAPDLLKIEKLSTESESRTEFTFLIRIERTDKAESWWPIEYLGSNDAPIRSETVVNGRRMVNLHKQDALVDLAETWARALEAQFVAKTVRNALL